MSRFVNDFTMRIQASYRYAGLAVVGQAPPPGIMYIPANYTYSGAAYVPRKRTRISIDLNVRVRGNNTYVGFEQVFGPVSVGELVEVYEAESGLSGEGRITEIDGERELVFISVDWSALSEKEPEETRVSVSNASLMFVMEPTTSTTTSEAWKGLVAAPSLVEVLSAGTGLQFTASVMPDIGFWPSIEIYGPQFEMCQPSVTFGNFLVVAA